MQEETILSRNDSITRFLPNFRMLYTGNCNCYWEHRKTKMHGSKTADMENVDKTQLWLFASIPLFWLFLVSLTVNSTCNDIEHNDIPLETIQIRGPCRLLYTLYSTLIIYNDIRM